MHSNRETADGFQEYSLDTFAKVSIIIGGLMICFVVLGAREYMVSQADHAFVKRVFWCGVAIAIAGPLLATLWTYIKKRKREFESRSSYVGAKSPLSLTQFDSHGHDGGQNPSPLCTNLRFSESDIMAYEQIQYEVSDYIATITLNRPDKLNAWTPTMEIEVFNAFQAADKDDNVRVIILTGAGRGFCAGADLQFLDMLVNDPELAKKLKHQVESGPVGSGAATDRLDFRKTYSYFPTISKPVIAALNGPTVGLGFVISLYCDIRFASDQAKFSTAFSRRGLIAEHGISWMLPRLIGVSNALDLIYSARLIDATEAQRMGLVSRVVPGASLISDVRAYASDLANNVSPRSMRVMKKQVYEALFQDLGEAIDVANDEMLKSFHCEDFHEGVAHFLQKRPAKFTGK